MARILLILITSILAYMISIYVAAFNGLQLHLGGFFAVLVLVTTFYSRLFLVVVICSYLGMIQAWQWHWLLSAVYLSPAVFIAVLLIKSKSYLEQWNRTSEYVNGHRYFNKGENAPAKKKKYDDDDIVDRFISCSNNNLTSLTLSNFVAVAYLPLSE